MNPKARILFVSHAASRNGATILLLHMLRWLKEHSDHQFEVLVNGRGELLREFQELCPTRIWRNPELVMGSLPRRWREKLAPRMGERLLKTALRGQRYEVVHINTAAAWHHVPILAQRSGSLLWHIHELGYGLRTVMGEAWRQTFPQAKRFVAVSEAVRYTLVNDFEVPNGKVDLVRGFISISRLSEAEKKAKRAKIRAELGWGEDVFVAGGCGTLGWRKGTDLFLNIAELAVKGNGGKIAFLWVGGGANGEEAMQFEHDLRALGLRDCCKRIPATANVADCYHAMDVFTLTSREDPFPLVMLEAGAAGLPVICFAGAGGGPEFVGNDKGFVVPYLDLAAFAKQVQILSAEPGLRRKLGEAASREVEKSHVVEKQAPLLLKSIEECMRSGQAGILAGQLQKSVCSQ